MNGRPSGEQALAPKARDVTIQALASDVLGVTLVDDLTGDRHLVISNIAAVVKANPIEVEGSVMLEHLRGDSFAQLSAWEANGEQHGENHPVDSASQSRTCCIP